MICTSLMFTSVRIIVWLSGQEIHLGSSPWPERQTLFELHPLPTNVFIWPSQVPTQDPTLCLMVMTPYFLLTYDGPSVCPVFHDLDTIEEFWSGILENSPPFGPAWCFLMIRLKYCMFGKDSTDVMSRPSQCSMSGEPGSDVSPHWWCWSTWLRWWLPAFSAESYGFLLHS